MKNSRWLLAVMAVGVGVAAVGCGDSAGLHAEGSVALVVHQSGQPDGSASFTLPANTFIDAPPGVGRGFYGACARSGNRWTVEINRADASAQDGLKRVAISVPERSASGAVNASFVIGSSTFAGSSECTATATPATGKGVQIMMSCTGIRSGADPRTVDATVSLLMSDCTLD